MQSGVCCISLGMLKMKEKKKKSIWAIMRWSVRNSLAVMETHCVGAGWHQYSHQATGWRLEPQSSDQYFDKMGDKRLKRAQRNGNKELVPAMRDVNSCQRRFARTSNTRRGWGQKRSDCKLTVGSLAAKEKTQKNYQDILFRFVVVFAKLDLRDYSPKSSKVYHIYNSNKGYNLFYYCSFCRICSPIAEVTST